MNILHYSLGFPPYRTGGLTKFCMDLMKQQLVEGNQVSLLWPGAFSVLHRGTHIRVHNPNDGISSFEVINPTPISYDEGIVDTDVFMNAGDEAAYETFLDDLRPDMLHIHTLMGLHKALLTVAKRRSIRIVFSAHDFFPICPKVTMFRDGRVCGNIENCKSCPECNGTALPLYKIALLQSGLYRKLKDSYFVKKLRKQHRDNYLSEAAAKENGKNDTNRTPEDYKALRQYYRELVQLADMVHYNSSVTQSVYERFLDPEGPKAVQIPITHADIGDHRKTKTFDNNLRITYLGPAGEGKGFFLLQKALDKLWNDPENGRQDFRLNVYFRPAECSPYMDVHDRYTYSQLEEVFDSTDVLVAPSIWYETFGYTVLEAMSYGVPVIISDTVGAKDIIPDGAGIIVEDITAKKLARSIQQLSSDQLQNMNALIMEKLSIMTLSAMSEDILKMCYL